MYFGSAVDASERLTISISKGTQGGTSWVQLLDPVTVNAVSTVPEPTGLALALVAGGTLAGAGTVRRRLTK